MFFSDIVVPSYAPDERQDRFHDTAYRQHLVGPTVGGINTHQGYPASSPDLAWLQTMLVKLYAEQRIRTVEDVREFLSWCVQRVKKVVVFHFPGRDNAEPRQIFVAFKTRDDKGWYVHQFSLFNNQGLRIEGASVMKSNRDLGIFTFTMSQVNAKVPK